MSILGISGASQIYPLPSNTVNPPQSQTGTGLQQQQQPRVDDHAPSKKGVTAEEEPGGTPAAGNTRLGSIINVIV